jgi:hypothetical protein
MQGLVPASSALDVGPKSSSCLAALSLSIAGSMWAIGRGAEPSGPQLYEGKCSRGVEGRGGNAPRWRPIDRRPPSSRCLLPRGRPPVTLSWPSPAATRRSPSRRPGHGGRDAAASRDLRRASTLHFGVESPVESTFERGLSPDKKWPGTVPTCRGLSPLPGDCLGRERAGRRPLPALTLARRLSDYRPGPERCKEEQSGAEADLPPYRRLRPLHAAKPAVRIA